VLAPTCFYLRYSRLTRHARPSISDSLEGWVTFLTRGSRLFCSHLRLPVAAGKTCVAAAESPSSLPMFHRSDSRLSVGRDLAPHAYLFAGQFASFVVTSDSRLISRHESANRIIAHHLSTHISAGEKLNAELSRISNRVRPEWGRRSCVSGMAATRSRFVPVEGAAAFSAPAFVKDGFPRRSSATTALSTYAPRR